MSRAKLTLYLLDRAQLKQLSSELEMRLANDDRDGLAALLEIDADLRAKLDDVPRLVDLFLRPDDDNEAAPLFSALRRVTKKRALTPMFASDNVALEGRLRAFDALREDPVAANAIDKLLSSKRLPWYLRVSGSTGGWIDSEQRDQLSLRLRRLRSGLTAELNAFADGLEEIDGDVIAHDGL